MSWVCLRGACHPCRVQIAICRKHKRGHCSNKCGLNEMQGGGVRGGTSFAFSCCCWMPPRGSATHDSTIRGTCSQMAPAWRVCSSLLCVLQPLLEGAFVLQAGLERLRRRSFKLHHDLLQALRGRRIRVGDEALVALRLLWPIYEVCGHGQRVRSVHCGAWCGKREGFAQPQKWTDINEQKRTILAACDGTSLRPSSPRPHI